MWLNFRDRWKEVPYKKTKNLWNKLEVLKWFLQESNQGHMDFQSIALPTELSRQGQSHYKEIFRKSSLSCYIQSHFPSDRLLEREHRFEVSIVLVIISEDMEHWVDEEDLELLCRCMSIFCCLDKYEAMREDAFSDDLVVLTRWEILEIVKWEDIRSTIFFSIF